MQGLLGTSPLKLRFFGEADASAFVFAVPLTEGRIFELPMKMSIANEGGTTARDIELFLRIPRRLIYGGKGVAVLEVSSDMGTTTVKTVAQTEQIETLLISITRINPGIDHGVSLTFSVTEQTRHQSSVALDAANVNAKIPYVVYFGNIIESVISQDDRPVVATRHSMMIIDILRIQWLTSLRSGRALRRASGVAEESCQEEFSLSSLLARTSSQIAICPSIALEATPQSVCVEDFAREMVTTFRR